MNEQLHIVIYAASAARRSRIAGLVRQNMPQTSTECISRLSIEHLQRAAAADVLLADLESPSAAASLLEVIGDSPTEAEDQRIAALIDDPDPEWVRAGLAAGVNAIITREADREELRLAIDAAVRGLVLLHPSSSQSLTASTLIDYDSEPHSEHLTPREREVLRLIGEGLGNKQIAARLAISEHTAKFHISSILGKLNASSRAEAVSQGIRRGLIPI